MAKKKVNKEVPVLRAVSNQLCPMCGGYGETIPRYNIGATNAAPLIPCRICQGAGIIPMHIITT
jgi:DnaJ-class molecular chaperone